jgi:flagellar hook-associated protein 2
MAIRLSGLVSGMDTESIVSELMKAQNLKKTKIQNKITTSEWKQEKWKDLNSKIYSFYTGSLSKMKMQGSFNTKKVSSSDESKVTVTANTTAAEGSHTLKILQLAKSQFVTGDVIPDINSKAVGTDTKLVDLGMTAGDTNKITITAGSKTPKVYTITDKSTIADLTTALKDAGLNASYDTAQKRFFISSKESGTANAFTITTAGSVDLSKVGLSTITKDTNPDDAITVVGGGKMTVVQPSDAKIIYNDVAITSSSNQISVNGLTLTLKGLTDNMGTPDNTDDDEAVSLNVTSDVDAVYNMVKDFVKSYNEVLKAMNDTYNAEKADGYEPLTDEQKESMSDDQVEKWETKIKDALLRRDNNLGSLINTMRSTFSESVEIDSKDYSLANFGITSVNYTEKGQLHISGDADDSLVSGSSNKLKEALTNDPDKVMKVINGLTDKLYTSLTKSMKSTTIRSALTLYNDKEIANNINDYKEDLSELEKKLQDMENRYYKQFSAMESAMSKMNSQSSSMASMLGTSSK